ncbi:probable G-protein coupled receptor AH9.1, partial [Pollicipes pollicipes]|uniref:probable G-protein coupled receptor AH9.1 n=1 Tax=Pollicipes pollicipes TaxID=41117 RepID=UPI0018854BEA
MDHPYLNVTDPVFTRRLHHVTYGVIAPLLVTAGIVGNVVCLPCLAAPRRWGVTRFFLVVLSSVDTAIMLCLIPTLVRLAAPSALLSSHALAVYAAHVEQWLLAVTTCASIGTVVALTVDRFVSVCRQMEFKLVHRREVALRRVVVVFCVATAAAVPWF